MPSTMSNTKTSSRGDEVVNRRLQNLTGSTDVRINDKDFMHLLHDRLEEEHLKQEAQREKRLREEEAKRIRKLKREGVIDEEQYRAEMNNIQRPGNNYIHTHAGGADGDCHSDGGELTKLDIPISILTNGHLQFHENPEATTYRGYIEGENEENVKPKKKQQQHKRVHHQENRQNQGENTINGNEADGDEEDRNQQTHQGVNVSPRYLRPHSSTVDELEKEESIERMYTLAQSMVHIEVGLNLQNKGKKK